MIKIDKCDRNIYLIEDTNTMQRICLTRDELGQLHHLIDVQFMSEDPHYEKSMQPLTQEEINNEIAYDYHKNKWST